MKTGMGEAKNRGASCGRLLFFFFLGQLRKVFQIHSIKSVLMQIMFHVPACYILEADIHSIVTQWMLSDCCRGSRIAKFVSGVDPLSILYLFSFWKDSLYWSQLFKIRVGQLWKKFSSSSSRLNVFHSRCYTFCWCFDFFPLNIKVLHVPLTM